MTDEEIKQYTNTQDLLKYWAVKEAAYKLMVKLLGFRKLNPKSFNVVFDDLKVSVSHSSSPLIFDGELFITKNYVHAVVSDNTMDTFHQVYRVYHHRKRREFIRRKLANSRELNMELIHKDEQGIPRYAGWDISFSHSRPYSAWIAQKL